MLFGFGELGGVEQIDAHEPSIKMDYSFAYDVMTVRFRFKKNFRGHNQIKGQFG